MLLSETSVPEAVTAVHWSSDLAVGTAGGLHVLDSCGKCREVLKWRSRGPVSLAVLPSGDLCAAQDGRLQYYRLSRDGAELLGTWPIAEDAVIESVMGDLCALSNAYVALAIPEGVAVYLAAADASHSRLQLLQAGDAPLRSGSSLNPDNARKQLDKSGSIQARARGRGGPTATLQAYAVCCQGLRVACSAPNTTVIAVGKLGSIEDQVQRLRGFSLSREALYLCGAQEDPGREALLDDIRIEHGVRLCSAVRC
jgi:hypothetical protein